MNIKKLFYEYWEKYWLSILLIIPLTFSILLLIIGQKEIAKVISFTLFGVSIGLGSTLNTSAYLFLYISTTVNKQTLLSFEYYKDLQKAIGGSGISQQKDKTVGEIMANFHEMTKRINTWVEEFHLCYLFSILYLIVGLASFLI